MKRQIFNSNLPSINIKKENLLLLNGMDAYDIKAIINIIFQYVYLGKEIEVDGEFKVIVDSILDNIENIGVKYLNRANANKENGKKGGRPKKNKDNKQNGENDFKAVLSPQNTPSDTDIPKETESVSEGLKMTNTAILEENNLIGRIKNHKFEVMKSKLALEIEEQYLQDEDIVKKVSNEFINDLKRDAYDVFFEMNQRNSRGESYQDLWDKWIEMWKPYLCTDRRISLETNITNAVVNRYGERYYKDIKTDMPTDNVYSDELIKFLEENEASITDKVSRIARAQRFTTNNTEYIVKTYKEQLDKMCGQLAESDRLDFEGYINKMFVKV